MANHSSNEVLEILIEDSDEGQRLRQSSPFSGILSQRERLEVFRAMKRQELEHIVRVAAAITGETEFIIIGSQSILGKFPDAPRSLRQSMEADIYPKARPELAELISGSIRTFTAPSTTTPMAWPQIPQRFPLAGKIGSYDFPMKTPIWSRSLLP